MPYYSLGNRLGFPQIDVTATVADWRKFLGNDTAALTLRPGTTICAWDPLLGTAEFILAYGVASLARYDAVRIGLNYATTRTVAATRGTIAVSMSPNTATDALSWFAVRGQVPVNSTATGAVDAPMFTSATAGALTTAVTANSGLSGASNTIAVSSTVTTKTISTTNGSPVIRVSNTDGLYVGMAVTGTGVAANSVIAEIGLPGNMLGASATVRPGEVRLSNNCTATGTVTGTFSTTASQTIALLTYPSANALA
jgi:hypothetical protein